MLCQQLFTFIFQSIYIMVEMAQKKKSQSLKILLLLPIGSKRRKRDLNPRAGFPTYTLSRGASSASWVLLQSKVRYTYSKNGGESGIRTHGTLPYGSFQDCFLKPLGHLSSWALAHAVPNAYLIYQISGLLSSPNWKFFVQPCKSLSCDNLFLAGRSLFSLQKHLFVVQ